MGEEGERTRGGGGGVRAGGGEGGRKGESIKNQVERREYNIGDWFKC